MRFGEEHCRMTNEDLGFESQLSHRADCSCFTSLLDPSFDSIVHWLDGSSIGCLCHLSSFLTVNWEGRDLHDSILIRKGPNLIDIESDIVSKAPRDLVSMNRFHDDDLIPRNVAPNEPVKVITTRAEDEEVITQSDFLYRVIDSLTHPFYVIDVNDYTIKMANHAALVGNLKEKTTCHAAIHRSPVPCWEKGQNCPLVQIKKTKKPAIVEHMHFDETGDLRVIEVHAYPIFNPNGEVVLVIEYGLDITDQKWIEGQLAKESRRARLYLDLLAHDMANELQVIQGSAELAKEILAREDEKEMIPRFVNQIVESVNRCMNFISEARSTENLIFAPLVERSLTRALVDCVETIGERFENCIIEIEGESSDAFVMADKYLENLIINILSNAVKHNPTNQKRVWVRIHPLDDGYEILISDNGPGIEDVMKEILFDPKYRFGGLGIHFSLQIIEKYGGKINVRDRIKDVPKEGVEFAIWFPKTGSGEINADK
jgi:nitrogen fixation/metabolism regulation signal transduction histidine kinase